MFITLKNGIRGFIPCQSAKTQSVIVSTSVHAHLSALLMLLSEASLLSPRVHGIGQEAGPMQTRLEPLQNASHRRCEKFMSSGCFNPGPSHVSRRVSVLAVCCPEVLVTIPCYLHASSLLFASPYCQIYIRKRWAKSMHATLQSPQTSNFDTMV